MLGDAVKSGRVAGLRAIRDVLAAQLEACEPREAASLARQLRLTLEELERLDAAGHESDVVDDLAAKRARRRAANSAKRSGKAKGRNVGG